MSDRTGQQLDEYHLLRLLGQGTFGEVYLAEHIYEHTDVAVKVLTTPSFQKAQEWEMILADFLREARTLFRLKHPSIVPLLDFGLEQKTPFLVMKYAPNGTLRQRHQSGVRVPLDAVNTYVQQVAAALQYAHERRLIHRDVKPQNMLLDQGSQVLLSDFGIVAIAHTEHSLKTQEMMGTIPYMAPEQIRGKPHPASDQYALAVCVYEWLCGVRPFTGSSWELISQHFSAEPSMLRSHVSSLPGAVEEVVLRALDKDPQQRFASVAAFANAFQQASRPAATSEPVEPTPLVRSMDRASSSEPSLAELVSHVGPDAVSVQVPNAAPPFVSVQTEIPALVLPTVASAIPSPTSPLGEMTEALPDAAQDEQAAAKLTEPPSLLLQLNLPDQSMRNKRWVRALVAACLVALLVASGLIAVSEYQNHMHSLNLNATSTAAGQIATTEAQSTATAQAFEKTQTAFKAQATATAQSIAYPSYMAGGGTLKVLDPLNSSNEWSPSTDSNLGVQCFYKNDALHITEVSVSFDIGCPSKDVFGNFALEVQMTIIMGDCGGVIFGGKFNYVFNICSNGNYSISKSPNAGGTLTDLASGNSSVINTGFGVNNTLGVVANNAFVMFYVNHQKIASDNNSDYSSSGIFLVAYDIVNATEVIFRNVRIWS